MEDKENNINNNDLLNSSMFAETNEGDNAMASMFSDNGTEDNSTSPNEELPSMFDSEPSLAEKEAENSALDDIQQNSSEETIKEEIQKEVQENGETPIQVIEDNFEEEDNSTPTDVVTVRPVKFKKFEATPPVRTIKKNLDIMQDISMHVSVELGRTKLSIKEVMDFEQGSVVELDKIAGEQVEVYVNGKIVAKGEVIVIEDRFGVRITSTNITNSTTNP